MPAATATKSKERLVWPDVAKGVSIIGVVLLHVSLAVPQGMDTLAAEINRVLDPLRMPLFFLVSGFFSVKLLRYSFGELFAKRLWFFIVPYVIWVPFELWTKFREYNMFHDTPMPGPEVYLQHLVEARNMAWFLYALTLFSFILWASRKLPTWAGIAVGFAPLLILPLNSDYHMVGKAVMYLPVFILGARLRALVNDFSRNALEPKRIVIGAGMYVAGFGLQAALLLAPATNIAPILLPLGQDLGQQEYKVVVNMMVHLLMMPAAIIGAVLLAKIPVVSTGLQTLGRNTLPIYLGHPIALTVLYHYNVRAEDWNIQLESDQFWSRTSTWMVVALVISAIGSLAFYLMMKVPVLKLTLAPPRIDHLVRQVGFGQRRSRGAMITRRAAEQPENETAAVVAAPGSGGRS